MKGPFHRLGDQRLWPLGLLLVAAVLLLSGIGSQGFWEPHEIQVADQARERLEQNAEPEGAAAGDKAEARKDERGAAARAKHTEPNGPPLTEWAVAKGISLFGVNELGARLPLALLGLLAVMGTFLLGWRLATPRAGLVAAFVLLSSPLFLFQARQLNSDIGAITGSVLIALGLVGLATRSRRDPLGLALGALDAIALAAGAAIAYYAAGALLGLIAPLGAVAAAGAAALITRRSREEHRPLAPLLFVTGLAGACALGALAYFASETFHLIDAFPGDHALFGKTLEPVKGYVAAIGGHWRVEGDARITYDSVFREVAFGMFPWSAIAPIAVAELAVSKRRGRPAWATMVVFAWALLAWVLTTLVERKVGPAHYPALAAVALACGIWADRILTAREREQGGADPEAPPATWPLVGLFACLAAPVVAKDLATFPGELTSINLAGITMKYPEELGLHHAIPVFGAFFGAALLYALAMLPPTRAGDGRFASFLSFAHRHARHGVVAAVLVGLGFSAFLVFVWTPTLSRKLSSKHLFAVYHELRDEGDALGILGHHGSGPDYYAGGPYEELRNRNELLTFLKRDQRVFALTRASELCPVHKEAAKGDFEYHVLDNSHARYLLLSNRLEKGEVDENPLARAIVRQRPKGIKTPLDVNFDDKIQLIGVNMPRRVGRGDRFRVTLYFKVLARIRRNWKIFMHFDGGGMRFQGDHDPIAGRCGTAYWQPGDYIVDTFDVEAGGMTYAKTNYRAWVGFFVGANGNWTNMKVKSDKADQNNRVPVGVVEVR